MSPTVPRGISIQSEADLERSIQGQPQIFLQFFFSLKNSKKGE
jgi:hypothetical protein